MSDEEIGGASGGGDGSFLPPRVDGDGIAWLDLAGDGGIVLLSGAALAALERGLADIERRAERGEIRGVVVEGWPARPPRPERDLEVLLAADDAGGTVASTLAGQAALRRLEQLAVPSVAAIAGSCLGANLELALACSYRVAAATAGTRFGLPQVRLGMIPGLGATVRLPRLVGLEAAIRLIVRGESIDHRDATRLGLVDVTLPPAAFEEGVAGFLLERIERGRMRTGARRGVPRRLLEDTAPGRRIVLRRASRRLAREASGPTPALRAALQSIGDGLSLKLERAFEREAELYAELLVSDEAKSLIHAALLDAESTHPHPERGPAIERLGILGAGDREVEVGWAFARSHLHVRVKDRQRSVVAGTIQLLRDRLSEPGVAADEIALRQSRVEGAIGFGGFGTLDLVATAQDDAREAARMLAESEEHVSERCILASTSPLAGLAEARSGLRDPSRAVGLFLTTPAELFPVMEIAAGPETDPEVLAAACRLARRLGRTPVHSAEGPGFLVYRLLAVYIDEAGRLLDDGAAVADVDGTMEDHGFVAGPLRRVDALGSDRAAGLLEALSATLAGIAPAGRVLGQAAEGRARFYRYRRGRPTGQNRDFAAPAAEGAPDATMIRTRVLLRLVNESARLLEEGVAAAPADVDLALIFGLGYPRHGGGLLWEAARMGLGAIEAKLGELAASHDDRFLPAPLIRELAATGGSFYRRDHAATGHARVELLT